MRLKSYKLIPPVAIILFSSFIHISYADVTTSPSPPVPVSPLVELITRVQSANYPIVKNVELSQGVYKIQALNRLGHEVEVEMDPTTFSIIKPKEVNTLRIGIIDAVNLVTNAGYHNIYKIKSKTNSYEVQALDKEGNKVELTVDGATGKVSKDWF